MKDYNLFNFFGSFSANVSSDTSKFSDLTFSSIFAFLLHSLKVGIEVSVDLLAIYAADHVCITAVPWADEFFVGQSISIITQILC